MAATADSWKHEPFTAGTRIPFKATFALDEVARLEAGLVPEAMEDKWFIHFDAPCLFLHRSWTGKPVYRVELKRESNGASVVEALWAGDFSAADEADAAYQALLLEFLIANLLLGQAKPFPRLADAQEAMPGILQHHVAGTRFQEVTAPKKTT
jgi:hypothetical protein